MNSAVDGHVPRPWTVIISAVDGHTVSSLSKSYLVSLTIRETGQAGG
jgi:hypothetical protein